MQAEKKTGAGEVTDFGCAAVVTGSLVDEQSPSRPDHADGELPMGVAVNRSRTDAFVLRILRCLTFEVSWRRRRGALDSKRKMGRRPSA